MRADFRSGLNSPIRSSAISSAAMLPSAERGDYFFGAGAFQSIKGGAPRV
jgi:hypothetical protein